MWDFEERFTTTPMKLLRLKVWQRGHLQLKGFVKILISHEMRQLWKKSLDFLETDENGWNYERTICTKILQKITSDVIFLGAKFFEALYDLHFFCESFSNTQRVCLYVVERLSSQQRALNSL